MRKFLSVIVPRYQESEAELFPLLSSVNTQVGFPFEDMELIIANDGTEPVNEDFLRLFFYETRQATLEKNGGPGVARQAGLEAARGEYVLFCDADDILQNAGVLGALTQEAEKTAPDLLYTSWLEEQRAPDGRYVYITHERENTWMHGKLLRRQFLMQSGVRFHDKLRVHEDSYFLCIAAALAERSRFLPVTSYIWKWRADSITRRNGGAYTYDSIPVFIDACLLAHKEVERLRPEKMPYMTVQFVLYNYFTLHRPDWQTPEHEQHRKDAEDALREKIAPFWKYWEGAGRELIARVYNEERAKSFSGGVEAETLEAWIDRLGLGKPGEESEPGEANEPDEVDEAEEKGG